MLKRFIVALVGGLMLTALPAAAQQISQLARADSSARSFELTAAQRSQIAESIIARWSEPVKKSPGGDVKAWSAKLREVVSTADSANVIRASQMPSFALVHSTLIGAAIDDTELKKALSGSQSADAPLAFGSYYEDTAYTPLAFGRCRVASSLATNNPLSAGVVRGIEVEGVASYASQGGTGSLSGNSSTACTIPTLATAYAVSVSARNPVADGVLKVFPYSSPNSVGNTIFFSAAANGGGSDLIVRNCFYCTFEIGLMATAQTDYIIDIIGYFMPPNATALECLDGPRSDTDIAANSAALLSAPACPAGYTETGTECSAGNSFATVAGIGSGSCLARNPGGTPVPLQVNRRCCRVPGR